MEDFPYFRLDRELEKREFIRPAVSLEVEYRFVYSSDLSRYPQLYRGRTENISGGGLLLRGEVPCRDLVPDLLMGKVLLALRVFLPGVEEPLLALGRVIWVEGLDEGGGGNLEVLLGVGFREISLRFLDVLIEFVVDRCFREGGGGEG